MPAEDGKEAKDLDAEEGEGENVRGAGEAGSEHGAGHEGGVGGERGRELWVQRVFVVAVVEAEDVDY